MNTLLNLVFAILVFVFAQWLLGLVGLHDPWATLAAILVAVVAFLNDPIARVR